MRKWRVDCLAQRGLVFTGQIDGCWFILILHTISVCWVPSPEILFGTTMSLELLMAVLSHKS
jgi:hypothetical protein